MTHAQAESSRMDLPRATLGVLIIVALIALTIWILLPFLGAIVWASLIVVATWPVMRRVQAWCAASRTAAVVVMTGLLLLVLVLPLAFAIGTIASSASEIATWAASLGAFTIPPPPAWLITLPVVGTSAANVWQTMAASRLPELASAAAPYGATVLFWVAGTLRGAGALLVQFLLTVAIAAVMYAKGEHAAERLLQFGQRLAGEPGDRVVRLAAQAIRGVALGVVVTAIVQAALSGVALAVAGVPLAVLWGAVAFVLCIAQLGPVLVLIPAVGWLYWTGAIGAATGLLVGTLVIGTLDNVLRPMLMSRGVNLPMLLMFAGVMGGLLAFGLIGIFIGPVVLAVTYTLLEAWLGDAPIVPEEVA